MKQEPGTWCAKCGDIVCKHGLCSNTGTETSKECPLSVGQDGYQCQDCAEQQQEEFLADYYGGDSPFCESHVDKMARLRREKDGIL